MRSAMIICTLGQCLALFGSHGWWLCVFVSSKCLQLRGMRRLADTTGYTKGYVFKRQHRTQFIGGILSIGIGVVVFSNEGDSAFWKGFCFFCGVIGAFLSLDDWEECYLDKKKNEVQLRRLSLIEKVISPRSESSNIVTAFLSHITDVKLAEEDVRFFGRAKYLLLEFKDGYSLPLTQKATKGSGENHRAILQVIQDFLQLDEAQQLDQVPEGPPEEENDSMTSSSSSFEQLPASVEEEKEMTS